MKTFPGTLGMENAQHCKKTYHIGMPAGTQKYSVPGFASSSSRGGRGGGTLRSSVLMGAPYALSFDEATTTAVGKRTSFISAIRLAHPRILSEIIRAYDASDASLRSK